MRAHDDGSAVTLLGTQEDRGSCSNPPTLLEEGGFLTRTQVAKELGVSTRTIARWEVERIGPPRVQIGCTIFYRSKALIEWLESRERTHGRSYTHGRRGSWQRRTS